MSAIQSLLRVMTLRDAEAIVLEAGKVPSLRRRGQVEALAMPALEPGLLAEFATPLVAQRPVEDWPAVVPFQDPDGARYQCTIEKVASGLRIVVRPGKAGAPGTAPGVSPGTPPSAAGASAQAALAASPRGAAEPRPPSQGAQSAGADAPRAWWARPASAPPAPQASQASQASHAPLASHAPPAHTASPHAAPADHAHAPDADRGHRDAARDGLAQLARLLAGPVAIAREHRASDVLLSTGRPPQLRVDGRLEPIDFGLDDAELAACVRAIGNSDHSLELAGARLRINTFEHLNGVGVAARLIRERVPTLGELALPPELLTAADHRDGLVLVCGPTGSGKSTTLAAIVDQIDHKRAAHVITLEDPIEYRFSGRRCLVHQREIGTHVPSFAAGLRAALREAPDVILLGEMRDRETIAAALTAAETGHLVLATLHAPSAIGAVDRIIDAFPDVQQRQIRWQLAACLRSVVTQYLLPRRDGGRAVAVEFVPATPAVANIIRKGDLHTLPTAIQSGREAGMIPLERSLAKLLDAGVVSSQAVRRIAADHDLLSALSSKLR